MTLYELNHEMEEKLTACIDPETGEVDENALADLNALQMDFEEKVENYMMAYKNKMALANALDEEEKSLEARKKSAKNVAEWLKSQLDVVLDGKKFESAKGRISYRSSSSVDIEDTDQFAKWAIENHHADFVKVVPEQYKPDKKEIGKYIKKGGECPFAEIKTKRNMQIK